MRILRTASAVGLMVVSVFCGGQASAQAPPDLAAGRQLFVEALSDEEHGRFAEALAKYKRVQLLRDTANVRYRMGSSLEHLGKIVQSVEAYTAAVRIGTDGGTAGDAEVVKAARARLDALGPKVAHVALRLPSPPPPEAEITVDGELVPAQSLVDLPLDPGAHVVAATAKGARPFRAQIDLPEGSRVEVPILLDVTPDATPVEPPPPPPKPVPPYRTIGIVTAAAGGAALIGGVIVLALRSSAIAELNAACPNGNCPVSRKDELSSTQDRAKLEGPLGVALLATGVAAIGAGIFMITLGGSETRSATRLVPTPVAQGAMLTLARGF